MLSRRPHLAGCQLSTLLLWGDFLISSCLSFDSTFMRAASVAASEHQRQQCPIDFVPMGADGKPVEDMRVPSVRTFVTDFPDSWWNDARVSAYAEQWQNQSSRLYEIASSGLEACGAHAVKKIPAGTKIDLVWLPDDSWWVPQWLRKYAVHVTPWYGSTMNHCSGARSNIKVQQLPDESAWGVAARDIEAGEELLVDYNEVFKQYPMRILPASPFWSC
mmetsp:Transcript_23529/g.54824  ORF Transcript_23529/g.54824 Transcript_23529/m.54824 type:complete len:218 (-) Transcript_23529:143-796(-)